MHPAVCSGGPDQIKHNKYEEVRAGISCVSLVGVVFDVGSQWLPVVLRYHNISILPTWRIIVFGAVYSIAVPLNKLSYSVSGVPEFAEQSAER